MNRSIFATENKMRIVNLKKCRNIVNIVGWLLRLVWCVGLTCFGQIKDSAVSAEQLHKSADPIRFEKCREQRSISGLDKRIKSGIQQARKMSEPIGLLNAHAKLAHSRGGAIARKFFCMGRQWRWFLRADDADLSPLLNRFLHIFALIPLLGDFQVVREARRLALMYRLVNVSLHQILWLNILYSATGW